MASQRTGGGTAKWAVWDRKEGRAVAYELTKREADATAATFAENAGGPKARFVGIKRTQAEQLAGCQPR